MSGEASQRTTAETRKLSAIMFTDMVGFSRQMGVDEPRTLRLLDVHNQIIHRAVAADHGTVIKTIGDAFLVDFPSVVHAVHCAQQIQQQLRVHNVEKAKDEQIHVRIGIHLGDIVQRDGDVFGDGVNIASRLQTLAEPDTICISDVVYRDVVKKLDLGTVVSLGRPKLKNIAERFQAYALLPEPPKGLRQQLQVQRLKLSRRVRPAHRMILAGLLFLVATLGAVQYLVRLLSTQDSALRTNAAPAALPLPDKPSIVVLPFTNMSDDPKQEYFSDGITEDITSDLSRISSLFVIARNSAFSYKGKSPKVQDVSKEMGVRYVLEGSVRKAGDQVRITAQLIDGTTGEQLWAERYDRELKDIFALQDEIVQKIVTTLKLQLTLREQGYLVRKTTDNLEAYDYFLRGLESWNHTTQEATAQAQQLFEKAIALDPQYAEAYAFLSWTGTQEWNRQWSQDPQTLERAVILAQKAVALDDSLAGAHEVLALAYLYKSQHEQAIAAAERAIVLAPNDAEGFAMLGLILNFAGRPEEAVRLIEKAMRLNPRYNNYLARLGMAYRLAGRYEEAIAVLQSATIRNPNFLASHLHLAVSYSELGRDAEARAEGAEILRISPNYSLEVARQRLPFKDPAEVERELAALRKAGLK
ncbi:MAG: adenylate/guanylate cyclase domain-containing protein [Deltaproteobacteria bacterium]|nr:adenylate/guanylate cyclase domain-containing protein [Deltaproteobacteria bacterium]